MKPNNSSVLLYLRIAAACVVLFASFAFAITATKTSVATDENALGKFAKFGDDNESLGNKVTRPGVSQDKGPFGEIGRAHV